VSYSTQLGVRVPAILYLPDPLPKTRIPAVVVVNGHGGDKYCFRSMPETKIGDWANTNHIFIDKLYATDLREGGTPALGDNVPGCSRDTLNVFTDSEWQAQRTNYILETWLGRAVRS
jgi:hypothetical protein